MDMNEKKQPMFSIIMACYNHEKYVETAITSILEQTYQDFELIVADDGSTDGSWEVIQKYSDRIKLFRLEENDFEKCTEMMMDMTTGKYLAQMSSDDYWYPNKLELQAKDIEENPNCYAYFTWAAFADVNLEITDTDIFRYHNRSRYEWVRTIFEKETVLSVNTMVTVNSKEKWLKYSKSVLNYRQLPDQMVLLKMLLNGDEIHVVPQIAAKERRHDNCIGAPSEETIARCINENISIWNEIWESMSDDFFVKAFSHDLYDKNVTDAKEIMCERMLVFLKLAESSVRHQNTAINYFTKHYLDDGIADILRQKYHFVREDFFKYTGKWGFGSIWADNVRRQNEAMFAAKRKQLIQMLLECNRKLMSVFEQDNLTVSDVQEFLTGMKEYLTTTLNTMKDTVIGIDFQQADCEAVLEHLSTVESMDCIEWDMLVNYLEDEAQRLIRRSKVL